MTDCTTSTCPCWDICERKHDGPRCESWDEYREEVRGMMREANRRMRDRLFMRSVVKFFLGEKAK